jgi:hypothetical protein
LYHRHNFNFIVFNRTGLRPFPIAQIAWPKRIEAYSDEAGFGNNPSTNAFTHFAGLSRGIAIDADPSSTFEEASYGQLDLSSPGDPESTADGKGAALAIDLERGLLKIGMDQFGRDTLQGAGKQGQPSGSVTPQGDTVIPGTIARRRPAAFDASKGTLLDPLLNTTYDLNYPKTSSFVEVRNNVGRWAANVGEICPARVPQHSLI